MGSRTPRGQADPGGHHHGIGPDLAVTGPDHPAVAPTADGIDRRLLVEGRPEVAQAVDEATGQRFGQDVPLVGEPDPTDYCVAERRFLATEGGLVEDLHAPPVARLQNGSEG